jgi:hypothetical protein
MVSAYLVKGLSTIACILNPSFKVEFRVITCPFYEIKKIFGV